MPTPLNLSWSSVAADETSIAGGFTQNAGGINVAVSYSDDGLGSSFTVESTDTQYIGTGEPMSTTSGASLIGAGGTGDTSTVTVDFDSVGGSGYSSEVENVMFRINDADNSSWTDILYVRAYDANGNQIDVSMTYQGATSTGTDPSVTGTGGNGSAASSTGSILVEIAGPVAYFEIDYNNSGTGGQALWLTDVHFDAISLDGTVEGTAGNDVIDDTYILDPDGDKVDSGDAILPGHGTNDDLIEAYGGNDSVTAGAGNDTIYAGTGTDTVDAGIGNDTVFGEAGDDSILGGAGADSIYAGADNDTVYGGADNDYVELGSGNDTFGDWSTDAGDDTVYGGDGADYINGGTGNDQIYGDAGNDTLVGAAGDDSIFGGTGDDAIWITDDHDTDVIVGGEDVGDGDTDTVSFYTYASTQGITVTATGDEAGTYAFDGTTASGSFSEIEAIETTDYSDTVDLSLDTGGADVSTFAGDDVITTGSGADTVDGGQGADTFNTGAGDDQINLGDNGSGSPDGDADVVVLQDGFGSDTITNFDAPTANGDGTFTGIDTFDASTLTDGTRQVYAGDIVVSDDGSGNALLTMPNGESITLVGIAPTTAENLFWLNAVGFPLSDGTVEGTAGADSIGSTYTGDPDGDMVDDGDAILPGDTGDDDLIYGYGGNDNIYSGSGADEVYGGTGDDLIQSGSGNSTLYGDADNDTIYSGSGNDTVYGGTGNDTVGPSIGSDEVYGGDGDDTISAGGFAGAGDTMSGDAGNDTLTGGLGDDTMFGGTGDDSFSVQQGGGTDAIQGGEDVGGGDVDTLTFSDSVGPDGIDVNMTGDEAGNYSYTGATGSGTFSEIETFTLTDQNDDFDGVLATGGNTVDAGAGDDVLTGSSGSDSFIGGTGNDTINANAGNDTLDAGDGADIVYGDEGLDSIFGGAGNDQIYGGNDADTIDGGADDDTLFGDAGDDTLTGGAGSDTITGGADQDVIYGGAGDVIDGSETGVDNDTLIVSGVDYIDYDSVNSENGTVYFEGGGSLTFTNIENVVVSDRDGTVSGTAGDDTINASYTGDPDGDQVDDTDAILVGHAPNDDLIEAGAGNDTVVAGLGDDTIYGEAGDDLIFGQDGTDTVFGGAGADIINGGAEGDTLYGGNDADQFIQEAGFGSDVIEGGEGGTDTDEIWSTQNVDVTVTATGAEAGSISDGTSTATFSEIEAIETEGGNDTINLAADTAGMTVDAGAGNDVITGGSGDDSLAGGADEDTFAVLDGFGNDTIVGGQTGSNYDTLDLSALTNPVTVAFSGPGAGTITDQITGDVITFSEIEQLILTDQADVIDATGDAGYTYIQTLDGNDSYVGSAGDDVVDEEIGTPNGQGNDTFYGGAGNDEIWAGTDNDTIFGGTGADTLNGQEGNDTITFAEGDTATGGQGDDLFVLEDLGEASNATITIDGGSGGETGGDTLQLGTLANLTQAVKDTFVDDGTGSYSGSVTLDDGTILNFSEIENIICFTPGTRIATTRGAVPVEDLMVGDLVVTRDHGLQPIRWIEGRTVPALDRFAPIRIRKNVLSGQDRDLVVSPQHRVLFQGYQAELLFGESEVLVPAKHLLDGMDVTRDEGELVTYVHMMFDQHEIIYAEGSATESFHPGDIGFDAVSDQAREELFSIFPELRSDLNAYGATARRSLKAHEAALLR